MLMTSISFRPDSTIVGHPSGSTLARFADVTANAFSFSGLDVGSRRGELVEQQLHLTAHQVAGHRAGALVRDVQQLVPVTDWNSSPTR